MNQKETKKNTGRILIPVCFVLLGAGCGILIMKFLDRPEIAGTLGGEKIRKILEDLDYEIADPDEAREQLNLKGGDKVEF